MEPTVGVTYVLKWQTKERMTVSRYDPKTRTVWGVYEKAPHLGDCPIDLDRIDFKETERRNEKAQT